MKKSAILSAIELARLNNPTVMGMLNKFSASKYISWNFATTEMIKSLVKDNECLNIENLKLKKRVDDLKEEVEFLGGPTEKSQ